MDANSWTARLSSASKRYQTALQSRSGMKWDIFDTEMLMGFEDIDVDDDIREEYPCPFCSEYFDIVGLCCHIDDEHPVEANNGHTWSFHSSFYLVLKSSYRILFCRKVQQPPMSIKDQEEKAKRCDFVQGLLLSMIPEDDNL
ncbi:hypothetical protein CDL12_28025 [Handroanthus impetiginosus]|uniref:Drought induced 19 protein type zinc-binding domain-containing protein n=1 Tax=Handroanthus impetiginosus TaxID=429701 RepID=A0A2G9G2W4_9LAMI|nr:hypothetical protein CDL12_28025 [Handroanthus impetiginosus]